MVLLSLIRRLIRRASRPARPQTSAPVLVIADNASSEAQVRPLLPRAGRHKVLVTSRHTLAGLGARLVDVTVLDEQASVDLLGNALRAARPGDDRISGDPDAARRLAETCGGCRWHCRSPRHC
jgi:hypothetical protein